MQPRKVIPFLPIIFLIFVSRLTPKHDAPSSKSLIITSMTVPDGTRCDWTGVLHLVDDAQRVESDLAIFTNIECPFPRNTSINVFIIPPTTKWSVGMIVTNDTLSKAREGSRHIYDARWYWYHQFLLELRAMGWKRTITGPLYDAILFVDVTDVIVLHNPFKCMKNASPTSTMWISEEYRPNTNYWMTDRYKWCGINSTTFSEKRILNAGLIGAKPQRALWLAKSMMQALDDVLKTATEKDNCIIFSSDMCVYNKVMYHLIHSPQGRHEVFIGEPFAVTYKNTPHFISTDSDWPKAYHATALDDGIIADCIHDKYNGTADAECRNGLIPYCAIHKWKISPLQ